MRLWLASLNVFLTGAFGGSRGLLFERQQRCENPGWVPCSNIPTKCCPPTDNCRIDLQKCCPSWAETCGGTGCWEIGAVCCSNGQACKVAQKCCSGGGCCGIGETCCPGTCCPIGTTCSSTPGYCRSLVPTRSPRPSTTSSTTSSTTTSTPTTTPPRPTTTASLPKPKTPKESSTTASTSTNECPTPAPSPTGAQLANLPIVEFIYYPSDYEFLNDIVLSVCLGFQSRKVKGNFDILTRAEGSGKCYRQRRRDGKCGGCCTGVYKDTGIFQTNPQGGRQITNCDEYPFASTAEGGDGAHRSCVVSWQNTFQGNELKRFYARSGVAIGDSFGVRVVGIDCNTVKESDLQGCGGSRGVKRQNSGNVLASGTSNWVIPAANGSNASNVLIIPFGDLQSGKYGSFSKLLSGEVDDFSIVSNAGNVLGVAQSLEELSTKGQNLEFELEEGEYGVGILASTRNSEMNMSFIFSEENGTQTSAVPSPSTSATAVATPRNSVSRRKPRSIHFFVAAIIFGFML